MVGVHYVPSEYLVTAFHFNVNGLVLAINACPIAKFLNSCTMCIVPEAKYQLQCQVEKKNRKNTNGCIRSILTEFPLVPHQKIVQTVLKRPLVDAQKEFQSTAMWFWRLSSVKFFNSTGINIIINVFKALWIRLTLPSRINAQPFTANLP